jgi:hypothetical protein
MVRYYRKFFRGEYPSTLMVLVLSGIWFRFAALATLVLARRGASRVLPH